MISYLIGSQFIYLYSIFSYIILYYVIVMLCFIK